MIVYAVSKGLTSGNNLNKRINRYKRGPSQHFASQAGHDSVAVGMLAATRSPTATGRGGRTSLASTGRNWCCWSRVVRTQSAPAERGVRITGEIEMLIKCRAVRVH